MYTVMIPGLLMKQKVEKLVLCLEIYSRPDRRGAVMYVTVQAVIKISGNLQAGTAFCNNSLTLCRLINLDVHEEVV